MNRNLALILALVVSAPSAAVEPDEEKLSFLRPAATGKGHEEECTLTLKRAQSGWSVVSVTGRGATRMTVHARYDGENRLMGAGATLLQGEKETSAAVTVSGGTAKVQRLGQPEQKFEIPPGVIVTSAPDWTDTFLLCRHYDRKKGGKQSFTGLWIHPTQPAQLLPFTIEREGKDQVEVQGKSVEFERFLIRIRGPNPYLAWVDEKGTMLKLLPLPHKEGNLNWLMLQGQETVAARLRPPMQKQ